MRHVPPGFSTTVTEIDYTDITARRRDGQVHTAEDLTQQPAADSPQPSGQHQGSASSPGGDGGDGVYPEVATAPEPDL